MNNGKLDTILAPVLKLDWADTSSVETVTKTALMRLSEDKSLLKSLITNLYEDEAKFSRCEKDYNIEKYVLFSDNETGVRLRMHVMYPHSSDIPHSHRMNFTSLILHGGYKHTLYSPMDDGSTLHDAELIKPIYIKDEVRNVPYYIDHTVIHNLRAVGEDKCVSLMLRSPAQKQRAIHYDFGSNETWWRYGSKERTPESLKNTREVTRADIDNLLTLLETYKVL
ncbi:hypothetical protein [Saccharospirillum salsuginis]|uniref:Uncharacterized protein n=1 Tax=Saccharospirillum salsuginis TaxID=418750 RepID=A0A918NA26_9GAMM|nr:hypothetical protein [Saccharospirillum salsuginis]GGX57608.1 hypothetical protein GCM10007392_26500 [Saccharospirillum salsuginis]